MAVSCSTVPAADSDAGNQLVVIGDGNAATNRGESPAGDGEEGIKLRARLHERDEVSGAHADECGRVGLSLGDARARTRALRSCGG